MCKYTHFSVLLSTENKRLFLLNSDPNDRHRHTTSALGHPEYVFILDRLRPEDAADFSEASAAEGIDLFRAVRRNSAAFWAIQQQWFHSAVAQFSIQAYTIVGTRR